jgi:glycosyltransferase involved in cell wall biosynthesis
MPEVLAEAGIYFEPEDPESIAAALRQLVHNVELRKVLAATAQEKSRAYSWEHCAADTFKFISRVAMVHLPEQA